MKRPKPFSSNSPNNPTGAVYGEASLRQLGELVKKKNEEMKKTVHIISDEAYRRLVYDKISLPNLFHYYPHTIRVTSHSKDLSLAGERIGYVAVSPQCEETHDLVSALVFANRILGFVNAARPDAAADRRTAGEIGRFEILRREKGPLLRRVEVLRLPAYKPQGAFYLFPNVRSTTMLRL